MITYIYTVNHFNPSYSGWNSGYFKVRRFYRIEIREVDWGSSLAVL